MKEVLFELPVPSTALIDDPKYIERLGRTCALSYQYYEDEEESRVKSETIKFVGVKAYKCSYMDACTEDMIETAYDKLVDCGETDWLRVVHDNVRELSDGETKLKHLMIYFDDGPCYEVICENFSVNRETVPSTNA